MRHRQSWAIILVLALGCDDAPAVDATPDEDMAMAPMGDVGGGGARDGAVLDTDAEVVADAASTQDSRPSALDAGVPAVDAESMVADAEQAPPMAVAPVSAEARYEVRVTRDVVYGQAIRRESWDAAEGEVIDLTLDVFEPVGASMGRKPALVAIHGGGFVNGNAQSAPMVAFCETFAARGFVAFSINYRLARSYGAIPADWGQVPAGRNQDQYNAMYTGGRDAKAAIRWVHANAEAYGVHPDHITALGGSAGSFIAVMLGTTDPADYRDELSLDADPTLAGTHLDARSDVATVIDHWGGPGLVDIVAMRDGVDRFDADDAPICIIHGRDDPTVPFSMGEDIRDRCDAVGLDCAFHPFDGGHGAWGTRIDGQRLPLLAGAFIVERQGLTVE